MRWLEDNRGWRVRAELTHPRPLPGGEQPFGWVRRGRRAKVLPASCRQIVLSRIASLCRQDAGSTLTASGRAAAFAGENTSRWTFNVQGRKAPWGHAPLRGLPQQNAQNAEGVALPDSLSSLRSFAAKSIMADRRDALSYGALDELRNSAILLIAATSKI